MTQPVPLKAVRSVSGNRVPDGDNIGERAGRLGLEIADVTGMIDNLAAVGCAQVDQLRSVVAAARDAAACNAALATAMAEARTAAELTRSVLSESADAVSHTLSQSIEMMESLSEGVLSTTDNLATVRQTIEKVRDNSTAIQGIAFETRLIALNARVEAARAGEAGKGFAVIANSIKSLADQVSAISTSSQSDLQNLQKPLNSLFETSHENLATARAAAAEAGNAKETSLKLQSLVSTVHDLAGKIETMADPVQQNIESGDSVREYLRSLVALSKDAEASLVQARERAQSILSISEDFMLFIVQSGIETPDDSILKMCQDTANQISALFEKALVTREINLDDLFDENYRPIAGSNPEQVMTRFTQFADKFLPGIQEPLLSRDKRITFCAAVDRNGYLPTHNLVYSKPQGADPAWNAANCRNRRIFADRTGLAAGRNERPFLLQTYRRDMGNGTFVLMKDASAPIKVRGRHWGGFRIAFKV